MAPLLATCLDLDSLAMQWARRCDPHLSPLRFTLPVQILGRSFFFTAQQVATDGVYRRTKALVAKKLDEGWPESIHAR